MSVTIYNITSSQSIGNTLSGVNQNYDTLDLLLTNIQTSAINYWIPMAQIYEAKKQDWKAAAKEIKNNFPNWQRTSTTFEQNSSRWITPIIAWYPCLFDYSVIRINPAEAQEKTLTWINQKYPVLNKAGTPNYLEYQKMIVYSLNYSQDIPTKEVFELFDATRCTTSDQKVCAYCTKTYHGGGVNCNNGSFSCGGGTSCSVCDTVNCYFDNGLAEKNSTIAASLTIEYQNKYEQPEINAFVYSIQNCEWVFESILATP